MKKTKSGWGRVSTAIVIALAVALNLIVVASAMAGLLSSTAYPTAAPVKIVQVLDKAAETDQVFTFEFTNSTDSKTYRQSIIVPAGSTSAETTVTLEAAKTYTMKLADKQSSWCYTEASAVASNTQTGDTFTATSGNLPYTKITIADLTRQTTTRTITLTANKSDSAMEGDTANVSNTMNAPVIKFDTQKHGNDPFYKIATSAKLTAPTESDYGSSTGLTLEGWYDNAACYGTAIDFSTKIFTENTTLYANWIPTKDSADGNLSYWISPTYEYIAEGATTTASTTANVASDTQKDRWNYVKEEWNVLKSKTEIQADMAVLSKGAGDSNPTYATVKAEWDEIMNSDKYHLYTVYSGGATEASKTGTTSALNGYAEFRLIEVSGSAGHLNVANDANSNDGSVVTFMAAHVLPTSYAMNTDATNADGWDKTALRTSLQSGGTIYNKFLTGFTGDIQPVNKLNNAGGGAAADAEGTTTSDSLWLLSNSELANSGTYSMAPTGEGTTYQWFKNKTIVGDGTTANGTLALTTRAGATPGSHRYDNTNWWERSPRPENTNNFDAVTATGVVNNYAASSALGVVPCFSFGTPVLTFDANMPNDADNVTSTTVNGVAKTTQRVDAGTKLTSTLIPEDSSVVITHKDGATKTYVFAGWSENKDFDPTTMSSTNDDNPLTQAELAAEDITLNGSKTYYAIWFETTGFWLGTKDQNAVYSEAKGVHYYFNEAQFAKWDPNYHNAASILADMKVLEKSSNATYDTVKGTWDGYYTNADSSTAGAGNQVRLYATYDGGASTAGENMYAEFRIVEVSGATGHLKTAGDALSGDGSVVTFAATHALPTAYALNTSSALSAGGWGEMNLRSLMNETTTGGVTTQGAIFKKFPANLSSNVYQTPKVATSGSSSAGWVAGSTTSDKFWLLSYSELFGENSTWITGTTPYFKAEGTQYAWYKSNVTNATGNNSSLSKNYTTRAGKVVDSSQGCWWLRSPYVSNSTATCFGRVLSAGQPGNYTATTTHGVVPAFSFGSPTVTFDANAPEGTTATVDGTNATVTKRVSSGTALDKDLIPDDSGLTCTTTDDSGKTYVFAGWSKTKTHDITYNDTENPWTEAELEATNTTITGTEVYYAIWFETNGFWLGTQDQSAILDTDTSTHYFFNEAQFAKWDVNYVPSSTILSNMEELESSNNNEFYEVMETWQGYYDHADADSNNSKYKTEGYNVRLYATYDGGKDATDYSGSKSDENMYVEFRIMEVPDVDEEKTWSGHMNVADDEGSRDGSLVTFMATHVLPTKYAYNGESTTDGWGKTSLRAALNDATGDIFKRFPSSLSGNVYQTPKLYQDASDSATSYDKFWIVSNGELTTTGELGNQYAWANGKVTNLSNNSAISYKTRDKSLTSAQAWWLRSKSTTYPTVVSGTGDPSNSGSYKDTYGVAPSFSFGSPIVTFDANTPEEATSATADGTDPIATVRKTAGTKLTEVDIPTPTITNGDGSTYVFAGWSTDKNAAVKDARFKDELAEDNVTIEHNTTYYAIWFKTTGFWLGTKGQYATSSDTRTKSYQYFDSEVKFAKYDQNYHNADEILADMAAMETDDTSSTTYTAAKTKWDTYYDKQDLTTAGVDNQIRLYSDYSGGTEENKYVEFRIAEVSGAAGHLNDSSDNASSDGSVVTFAATHSLPTAYAMNASATNANGWGVTNVRTLMNETTKDGVTTQGAIFKNFPTNLTSNILEASKVATSGSYGSWVKGTTTSDKFWLLSNSEVFGTAADGNTLISGSTKYFYDEGTRYAWFTKNGVNATSGWNSSNTTIQNNDRTRAGGFPAGVDSNRWWLRSPYVNYSSSFGVVNTNSYPYYFEANSSFGVVPAFSFGSPQVTFDSNAPEGTTATVDGATKVNKRVISGKTLAESQIPEDANVTCDAGDDTYYFAGWSTDKNAAVKGSLDKEELYDAVKDTPVTGNVTYYAIWLKKGFWLGTANADASTTGKFQTQVDFAKYDDNYVSQETIMDDMEVLEDSTNTNYTTVKTKWDGYYTNQDSATAGAGLQVHLYTWWNTATGESTSAVTTNGNQFVEFRIAEVSGAAGHINDASDDSSSDGSIVTFAATHALPTAKAMNSTNTNEGGWEKSEMRTDVFKNYVSTGLSDLSDYALEVPKIATSGNKTDGWVEGTTTSDKFWLLSNSEVFGTAADGNTLISGTTKDFYDEGTRYAWFTKNGVNATSGWSSTNAAINSNYKTRAGDTPAGASIGWWLRSPAVNYNYAFCYVYNDGAPHGTNATTPYGIVPAFGFGSPMVTFDANAPEGATATLDSGETKSKTTTRMSKGATLTSDKIPADGDLKCKSTDGKTYVFAGWSESTEATIALNSETNPLTNAELAAKEVAINSTKTYYAIWMETGDFWLGTQDQQATTVDATTHHSFFNEAQFAKWDVNYVNSATILADMTKLETNDTSTTTNPDYNTTLTKWQNFLTYADDTATATKGTAGHNVRLYATYDEGKYSAGNNMYVESRIMEVSGAAGHKNSSTTYDGSVVTFMATHVLPTTYTMNLDNTNNGGWGSMNLRKLMNNTDGTGTIYDMFPTSLTSNLFATAKLSNLGYQSAAASDPGTTYDKFWIPSVSELKSSSTSYPSYSPTTEGTSYAWSTSKGISGTSSSNTAIANYKSRASVKVGDGYWWERTPITSSTSSFFYINANGQHSRGWGVTGSNGVVPMFAFGSPQVTFDANMPTGATKATVDGTNTTKTVRVANGGSLTKDQVPDDTGVTCTASGKTYVFAGWSTSKSLDATSVDNLKTTLTKKDFIDDQPTFSNNTTYYAIWMESTGFWLGSQNQTATVSDSYDDYYFFNEAQFAKHDPNYMSSTDILADMGKLEIADEDTDSDYQKTLTKWTGYFDNADTASTETTYKTAGYNVRLYATYSGGENETAYDGTTTSDENKYAEFRIMEVSGADGHLNETDVAGSSDGSVVTFMATHVLPTAYKLNTISATNNGGWNSTSLRTSMNTSTGTIFAKLPTSLTSNVASVQKLNSPGESGTAVDTVGTTTYDQFWAPSYGELYSTGSYSKYFATIEGTTYQWSKDKTITGGAVNSDLAFNTRAGGIPGSCAGNISCWWERSPFLGNSTDFGGLYSGYLSNHYDAHQSFGVAPMFAFGTPMLRWDANAPSGTTATVDGTNSKTATRITDTTNGITLTTSNIPAEGSATCSSNKWVCVGWSTNKDAQPGDSDVYTQATLAAKSLTVKTETTYYAIWKEVDFWLGTKNETATKKADFANDVNFVSSEDILADMEILKDTSNSKYAETLEKWQGYYKNQDSSTTGKGYQVRLYSTWEGNFTDARKIIDFCILQVGEHDGDGSVVTFAAGHPLPSWKNMNTSKTNAGGWSLSDMKNTKMAKGGYVQSGLAPNLVENVFETPKISTSGSYGSWVPNTETTDKFWLLSISEIYGTAADGNTTISSSNATYYDEGSRYDLFTDNNVTVDSYSYLNGKWYWTRGNGTAMYYHDLRSPNIRGNTSFAGISYQGGRTTIDGNTEWGVIPCFSFGSNTVTFDANAPSGTTATVDGTNETKSFIPSGTTLTADDVSSLSDTLTCSVDGTTDSTYEFAGWALTPGAGTDDVVATNKATLVGKSSAGNKTYYAVWKDKNTTLNTGFWMADVDTATTATAKGTQESYYTGYSHYMSSKQILADVAVMNAGSSNSQYARVIEKWNEYYSKDIRLYSTWSGSDATAGTVNALVDFRILQVGEHDSDGSVVTFGATHALPTAKAMNSASTNSGSWADSVMRNTVMSDYVQAGLSSSLVSAMNPVQKVTTSGRYGSWVQGSTTVETVWLLSNSEVFGTAADGNTLISGSTKYFNDEGTRYAWFTKNGVNATSGMSSSNTAIQGNQNTRAGGTPAEASSTPWWLRSPYVPNTYSVGYVYSNGCPNASYANGSYGVVPCFTFGNNALVTFDANAPSGTTATVDGTNATTKLIASGSDSTLSSTDVAGLNATLTCSDTTYTFAGWAKSPGAANTTNTDDNPGVIATTSTAMAGKTVTNGETYYAIWKDTNTSLDTGFWMSDAEATASRTAESQYTSDGHYMSSKQILADVAVMNAGSSDSQYARVIEKWNEYYSKDIRLYSTWSGSDATAGTLNALVDFRILQVGEHDSDGSVVTFGATHSLPTAKAMNSSATNTGSWANSVMRNTLMSDYVQAGLSSSLVSAMNPVQKVTTSGSYGSWVTGSTTADTVWLLSNSEVFGTAADGNTLISGSTKYFYDEGTRYAWFTDKGVNAKSGERTTNDAIKNNYETRASGTPAGATNSRWWLRSPGVYNSLYFGFVYNNGTTNMYTANDSYGVVPCFTFGKNALVTFDANAPSGTTATVDGTNATTNTIVEPGTTLTSDMIPADANVTCSDSTWEFAGWAENPAVLPSDASKNAALAGTTISSEKTYYAIWKDTATSAFWLSSTNTTGYQVGDFTSDTNYRTGREVIEDVKVLRAGSSSLGYSTVLSRWNTYYSNDVKLYATYNGGANETMRDGSTTSALNGLVEFRIMEVSGEAGHLNTSGDATSSDGSVVTFMATHALPTAEQMSSTATSGWYATELRTKLQAGGDIYNKFPTALTNAITPVQKLNNAGGGAAQDAAGTTTEDAFWIISYSELYATGTYSSYSPKNEGTAYQWCKDKNINGGSGNSVLAYNTRSGHTPGTSYYSFCIWWERSPSVGYTNSFRYVYNDGDPSISSYASYRFGVAPAFSM